MLTEFEVRRELESIQQSDAPPGAKARKLLRLGRSLRTQADALETTQVLAQRSADVNTDRQLERMETSARLMREEIRSLALAILRSANRYRFTAGSR